jgi:hypothetical protein
MPFCCEPVRTIAEWQEREPSWHEEVRSDMRAFEQALRNRPRSAHPPTVAERFELHAERWDRETVYLSSPTDRIENLNFQAILGLARENREEVIRLLIQDMIRNQRSWFFALSYITGENPIQRRDAGRVDKMISAWTEWAGRHRIL